MKARIAASAVLAVGVLLGTSACNFFVPQSTLEVYEPSDGVSATLGDVMIRNAILVTADGGSANLVVTVVNSAGGSEELRIQVKGQDERITNTVQIPGADVDGIPGTATISTFSYRDGPEITFENLGAMAGDLVPVYFQYGDVAGQELLVPMLDNTMGEYSELAPVPAPSVTPIPSPSPEPEPSPSETPAG